MCEWSWVHTCVARTCLCVCVRVRTCLCRVLADMRAYFSDFICRCCKFIFKFYVSACLHSCVPVYVSTHVRLCAGVIFLVNVRRPARKSVCAWRAELQVRKGKDSAGNTAPAVTPGPRCRSVQWWGGAPYLMAHLFVYLLVCCELLSLRAYSL